MSQKEKHMLADGAKSFILEITLFQRGNKKLKGLYSLKGVSVTLNVLVNFQS